MVRPERLTAVVRDALCLAVGFGGVIYQQLTQQVSWELLVTYGTMIGISVGGNLRTLQQRAAAAAQAAMETTNAPSSSSAAPSASSGSSGPPPSPSSVPPVVDP